MNTLAVTCYGLPVQIEGDVDGFRVYFRAEDGGWEFTVYNEPSGSGAYLRMVGACENHPQEMDAADVWSVVSECIADWRNGERTGIGDEPTVVNYRCPRCREASPCTRRP